MTAGPATGVQLADRINDSLNAILSLHSGTSRPDYALADTMWLDVSGNPYVVKFYDGTDDIVLFYVDTTLNTAWMDGASPEVSVASGVTTDILAANSPRVFITGSSGPIGSFGTAPNRTRLARLESDILINHGTAIICPGNIDFQGRAGMQFFVFSDGSGNARIGPGMRADGTALVPGGNEEVDALTLTTAKIAMQLAAVKGSSINLIGEIADSFEDVAGLDIVNCVNTDTSETGVIKPTIPAATRMPVAMTSNTSPSGYTVAASTTVATAGFEPWRAFDRQVGRGWLSGNGSGLPGWLSIQLASAFTAVSYQLQASNLSADLVEQPSAWTIEGSNDGMTWDILDTRTGEGSWSVSEIRTYTFSNSTAYLYYRINVTAISGASTNNRITLGELSFYDAVVTNSMTAISAVYDVPAGADFVDAYFVGEPVDAITLNTDLTISATVDGSHFAAGTIEAVETVGGLVVYKALSMDVRSNPGALMQWKIETANGKMVKIHEIDVRVRKAA